MLENWNKTQCIPLDRNIPQSNLPRIANGCICDKSSRKCQPILFISNEVIQCLSTLSYHIIYRLVFTCKDIETVLIQILKKVGLIIKISSCKLLQGLSPINGLRSILAFVSAFP